MTNTTGSWKKEVYSPYDIAKVCQTSQAIVRSWLDDRKMASFRVPGEHRRVTFETLDRFMTEHHLPKTWNDQTPFEKFRVLVVEDDFDLLEIMVGLLSEDSSLDLRQEDRGFNAGLQIVSWHPDLILLDILMPEVTGFEVSKKLRDNPETQDIPVLAMTSLTSTENRNAVMEAGVSDFLGKPFHSDELLKRVRILLGVEFADGTLAKTRLAS